MILLTVGSHLRTAQSESSHFAVIYKIPNLLNFWMKDETFFFLQFRVVYH
jgi:hypothetical protein